MKENNRLILFLVILYGVIIFIIPLIFYNKGKYKGAEEVYKGNTYLKYTVVNNEKVDSCVIFK